MRRVAVVGLTMLSLSGAIGLPDEPPPPLARGTALYGFTYGWAVVVSPQGQVRVERQVGEVAPEIYWLGRDHLQRFVLQIERERPWELPHQLGSPIFEGPERTIEVSIGGRHARFILMQTPDGVTRDSLKKSTSVLARAVRVCEAIRALARDVRVQPCIDAP
jgi:hypothetical protein